MADSDTTAPKGFLAELRDAVSTRAALLVIGVFVIELAFIVSYLGAFHSPAPHRIPVAVVAPAPVRGQVVGRLNALPGDPVRARTATDRAEARRLILRRTVDAAVVINPSGTTDTLLVASAGGPSVAQTAGQIAQDVERANGRTVRVTDIRPPHPADGRGLSSFYLVIGLIVGGYVASSALAMSHGARPANVHRTTIRLGSLALLSIASGLGGAIIVDPVFGALPGHFGALWGIGALTTFTAAAVGMALQVLFGQLGVGLALLVFVVLGNPSAGGVYPSSLLPPFWSAIGQALPTGAATTLVRNTVYFNGNGTALAWWVLSAWAAGGLLVSYAASVRGRRALGTAA
ncbi:ABC transporter permease [Streptomyces sp. RPT161]|uniref:ABC transporter permease n=1 Tax=Streptomyces sp. RPT161 TaxID=3015993 RepID=UPI0022B91675|nr:ABC transporter permease [Streptomyces sp. RPT161]